MGTFDDNLKARIEARRLSSAAEELTHTPAPELLGAIPAEALDKMPPPWELDGKTGRDSSDARHYVEAGPEIVFRWLNPQIVKMAGFRYWMVVPAKGDDRFRLKNTMMGAPDNTVRRGGHEGDVLCWMPRHWWESKVQEKYLRALKQRDSSVARHQETQEQLKRGAFGYVTNVTGHHPTHTQAEGRSMERD